MVADGLEALLSDGTPAHIVNPEVLAAVRFVDNPEAAVLAAAKDMLRRGLVEGTAGNISARREDGNLVITPSSVGLRGHGARRSRAWSTRTAPWCRPADGRSPSSEMQLHLACYRAFDDIGSVIHSHPVWATMFAVAHQPIPACIDEFARVLRRGDPLRGLRGVRHTRRRPQRGQGVGGQGGCVDRQPRIGGGRPAARQGAARHRAGGADGPDRLGCKGSRWTSAHPRGRQQELRAPSTATFAKTRCRSWTLAVQAASIRTSAADRA